ncbi:hypothetical protein NZK33_08115 [Cyanobium sp. FGCU-6]|jgi:hypothetical protein|nr:hypothetical protein [Cyanobium sp. FGCU6]
MCFSARASFTAAALLLPLGAVAVRHALGQGDASCRLPLALTPMLFGLQQACEGVVWLGLGSDPAALVARLLPAASVAYLFFAYGFWPGWISFIAMRWQGAGPQRSERGWLAVATAAGGLFGLLLWLPLVLALQDSIPALVQGSLHYPVPRLLPGSLGQLIGKSLYAALIAVSLLLPRGELRWFGLSVLLSFVLTQLAWASTFASVWCFFSAALSLQIVWIVTRPRPLPAPEAREGTS